MMKFFWRMIKGLAAIAILILIFLCFLFYTTNGLKFALDSANKLTHHALHYSKVTGTLAGKITLQSLNYDSESLSVAVNSAQLQISPWQLLLMKLEFRSLNVHEISVAQKFSESRTRAGKFSMPLAVSIKQGQIGKFSYHDNKKTALNLNQIRLDTHYDMVLDTPHLVSRVKWKNLSIMHKTHQIQISQGVFTVHGTADAYAGNLSSSIAINKTVRLNESINFRGTPGQIYFTSIQIGDNAAKISGSAKFIWKPELAWTIHLQSPAPKTGEKNIPGFILDSSGKKSVTGLQGNLILHNLKGNFNKQNFSGEIHANIFKGGFSLNHSHLNMGDAKLAFDGGLNRQWDFKWAVTIPDLQQIFSLGHGSVNSSGKISGDENNPAIEGNITINELDCFNLSIGKLLGNFNIHSGADSSASIHATGINYKSISDVNADIQLLGDATANKISINVGNSDTVLKIQAQGKWLNGLWQGAILAFTVNDAGTGIWEMTKKTPLILGKIRQQLSDFCVQNKNQGVCTSLLHTATGSNIHAVLKNIRLENFWLFSNPKSGKSIDATPVLDATINLQKNPWWQGNFNARITPGMINFHHGKHIQSLSIQQSYLKGAIENAKLTAVTLISLPDNQSLQGNLTIADLDKSLEKQKLSGSVKLTFTNFSFLTRIFPILKTVSGKLSGELHIAGSSAYPKLSGNINLTNGAANIPKLGLNIHSIELNASTSNTAILRLTGSAVSGKGNVQLQGTIPVFSAGFPINLKLTGKNFLVINTGDYKAVVSPDLSLSKTFNQFNINGTITVPAALITPSSFSQASYGLSRDVVYASDLKKNRVRNRYLAQIQLHLGNAVIVNAMGLIGQLTGNLGINYNSSTTTTANGTLQIQHGRYEAYGQSLDVQTGKIIYTGGPIKNPGIDVVASKNVLASGIQSNSMLGQNFSLPTGYSAGQHVTVGVSVTGTLDYYYVNLFSDPSVYSQSDILSLLLMGKTTSSISGTNAQLLLKAADSLHLGGGAITDITQQMQQFFGLDELDVESQNYLIDGSITQATSLVLGKRITPRLSVSYSMGLLQQVSIFLANYSLTTNWSLQANASSQDTGMDIFYNIEK